MVKITEKTIRRTPGAGPAVRAVGLSLAVLAMPATAAAHDVPFEGANPWTVWEITPDIVLGTLVVAALYAGGLWRLRHRLVPARLWRHVAFLTGLAAVFLALQSPVDPIAEHVFAIHQVQHLLIRMIGPMLLLLAAPQAVLVAGTPAAVQRRIVAPVITNRSVRGTFGFLAHPVVATSLFIGALYVWQVPAYHDLAILNDGVHYLMHVTMLFAGLVFFWRVFDTRPAPQGTRYGIRLIMVWIATLSNIVLGTYLSFKGTVLYPAYETVGRLWHLSGREDELIGGAVIWIPSSMMGIAAVLVVIHMWGHQEVREEERRAEAARRRGGSGHNEPPMTAAEMVEKAAPKNRAMALGLTAFVIAVFMTSIAIGMVNHAMGLRALSRRAAHHHATRGSPAGPLRLAIVSADR